MQILGEKPTKILDLNGAEVRLFATEAPFFSRILFCVKNRVVAQSAIAPEDLYAVKNNMSNDTAFMNEMKKINGRVKNNKLQEFIGTIEKYINGQNECKHSASITPSP